MVGCAPPAVSVGLKLSQVQKLEKKAGDGAVDYQDKSINMSLSLLSYPVIIFNFYRVEVRVSCCSQTKHHVLWLSHCMRLMCRLHKRGGTRQWHNHVMRKY